MGKVLVADDEKALRRLIVATLEIGDFEVLEAEDGTEALKKAVQEKPDLAILDVMMPGMTGYEVCRHIKSNPVLKHMKVLILTAKGLKPDQEAAEGASSDYYMAKPFSPAELFSLVGQILGKQVKS